MKTVAMTKGPPTTARDTNRQVQLWSGEEPGVRSEFCNNQVVTSHYTVWNFPVKNLMEQFMKPANCYFAFLAVLQAIPDTSVTGGIPTIAVPLITILLLNAVKDGLEDYRRHRSDRLENDRAALLARKGSFPAGEPVKWRNIHVGNILIIRNNEFVPADVVLLASSHEEGHVYIETANLDGETNLKTKQAPGPLLQIVGVHEKFEDAAHVARGLQGSIECEGPNEYLYSFIGTMSVRHGTQELKVPLDEQAVVLRGCKVKNVSWAIGVTVYTGKESKIMMNSKEKKGRKLSHLEQDVGKFTGVMMLIQVILCLIGAIYSAAFDSTDSMLGRTYLNLTDRNGKAKNPMFIFVVRFFNFMILFSNFIPISLLVSMAFVKLIQAFFMYSDEEMVYQDICCMPRTSDLNEEMGQVEYVFSDKTGTLTCNVMDFRKFCVNGVTYGEGLTEIRRTVLQRMGLPVPDPPVPLPGARHTPHVDLQDARLEELLRSRSGTQYAAVRTLLMHLAINHEVVAETGEKPDDLVYSASSPDEAALCYGARHFGYTYTARSSQGVTLRLDGGASLRVNVLAIIKFTSARKRSSVIVRYDDADPGSGQTRPHCVLYTKGADSVIMERLAPHLQKAPETQRSMETLKEMAEDGLRTLCLAGRELQPQELDRWLAKYQEASCATQERQERMDEVADEIEKDLELQGITGIEDRLQEDVGNTIVKMAQAGIKVWMLTGDKTETAINIGVATGLLEPEMPQAQGEAAAPSSEKYQRPIFTSTDFEVDGIFQPQDFAKKMQSVADQAREASKLRRMYEGFVVDGKCLEVALEPENELNFVAICRVCKTVICCRVSPKQKGAVVRLIKREEKAVTLAIGDGANDCNMIQSADVGVGIRGLEGLQAFNVCDYGISQFRFLQFLLLVHGRWCYRRVAILVNYTFYKNVVVVLPQYFLGAMSGFSGQKLYNDFLYQSYNMVHSMLPIVLFGVLDQDVSKRVSLSRPELYGAGLRGEYLNKAVSASWLLEGLYQAVVVFFIPYYTMSNGNITHADGKSNDIWLVGTVVYLVVVITVNIETLFETCFLSWVTVFGICFSFFFWVLEQGYASGVFTHSVITSELHGSTDRLVSSAMLWLILFTTTALAILPGMQVRAVRRFLRPSVLHNVQEAVLRESRGGAK